MGIWDVGWGLLSSLGMEIGTLYDSYKVKTIMVETTIRKNISSSMSVSIKQIISLAQDI